MPSEAHRATTRATTHPRATVRGTRRHGDADVGGGRVPVLAAGLVERSFGAGSADDSARRLRAAGVRRDHDEGDRGRGRDGRAERLRHLRQQARTPCRAARPGDRGRHRAGRHHGPAVFREALAADAPEQVRRQVAGTGEILRRVAGCSTWSAPPPRPTPNWSSCGGPTWRSGTPSGCDWPRRWPRRQRCARTSPRACGRRMPGHADPGDLPAPRRRPGLEPRAVGALGHGHAHPPAAHPTAERMSGSTVSGSDSVREQLALPNQVGGPAAPRVERGSPVATPRVRLPARGTASPTLFPPPAAGGRSTLSPGRR